MKTSLEESVIFHTGCHLIPFAKMIATGEKILLMEMIALPNPLHYFTFFSPKSLEKSIHTV